MKKLIILGILILFLSGCAITNKAMKSFEGKHFNELVERWGPPSKVIPDMNGGHLVVYYLERNFGSRYSVDAFGDITGGPRGYTAWRMFWVNHDGYIYKWNWSGL